MFCEYFPQGIQVIEENSFESPSFNGLSMRVLMQYEDGINETDAADGKVATDGKVREPRAESRDYTMFAQLSMFDHQCTYLSLLPDYCDRPGPCGC